MKKFLIMAIMLVVAVLALQAQEMEVIQEKNKLV